MCAVVASGFEWNGMEMERKPFGRDIWHFNWNGKRPTIV